MDTRMRYTGPQAGRRDSSIIWFAEECRNSGVRLDGYVRAAESGGDQQLAEFFRRALAESTWYAPRRDRVATRCRRAFHDDRKSTGPGLEPRERCWSS